MGARQTEPYEYDIALSFAGEDRQYVEQVADLVNTRGIRVFFDQFEQASLWGSELQEAFDEIFQTKARFVVAFVPQHYASKPWPTYERRSAQARALIEVGPYFLPVRSPGQPFRARPSSARWAVTPRTPDGVLQGRVLE